MGANRTSWVLPGAANPSSRCASSPTASRSRRTAVLTVELFGSVPSRDRDAVGVEAQRLLGFAAPGNTHEIRFARIT